MIHQINLHAVPPATPVPNLSTAIARLSEQLAQLTTAHAKNSTSLTALGQERFEIDNREKEMREMVEKAEEKRAWFQSFSEWVEGVAGFLDEKVRINSLRDANILLVLLPVSFTRELGRRACLIAQGTVRHDFKATTG